MESEESRRRIGQIDAGRRGRCHQTITIGTETAVFVLPILLIELTKLQALQNRDLTGSKGTTESSGLSTLDTEGLEYADITDVNSPKCLLCQRQFKSLDVLQKHSRQSELHKVRFPYSLRIGATTLLTLRL